MTLRRFTAEGGTADTSLTMTNSATGGDQLSLVSKAGAATAVYSAGQAMHGTKSILATCPAAADTVLMGYGGMAASALPLEVYFYVTAMPTLGTVTIGQIRGAASPGGANVGLVNLLLRTTGKLTVTDAAGAVVKDFTGTLTVNTWYRFALRAVSGTTTSNGTIGAAYYLGDATTPIETAFLSTTANVGTAGAGALTDGRWGKLSGGDLTAYFDDPSVNDGLAAFIGPASALSATLALSPTSGAVPYTLTATATATGGTGTPKTYAFDWGDGSITSAQSSNVATHTVTAPGTYTATVTVVNT